jgi:hypothetical protein
LPFLGDLLLILRVAGLPDVIGSFGVAFIGRHGGTEQRWSCIIIEIDDCTVLYCTVLYCTVLCNDEYHNDSDSMHNRRWKFRSGESNESRKYLWIFGIIRQNRD